MLRKICYVYALVHNPTGKIYVGRTAHTPDFRVRQHISALRNHYHPNNVMQEDYETFGDDYSYYILYASTDDFLVREQEKVFMGLLKTRDPQFGYNTKDRTNDVTLKNFKRYSVPENWGRDGNKKLSEAEKKKLVLDESVV